MDENVERVLDELDGFRIDDEMTYAAYSRLHDLISEFDNLLTQEPGWISVKDRLPDEHDSIFAGRAQLSKYLWSKESDNVNVYVEFPDGTGRVTEGRLQDGKWWTRISPVLNPVVTHWKPLPEPPKEEEDGN